MLTILVGFGSMFGTFWLVVGGCGLLWVVVGGFGLFLVLVSMVLHHRSKMAAKNVM